MRTHRSCELCHSYKLFLSIYKGPPLTRLAGQDVARAELGFGIAELHPFNGVISRPLYGHGRKGSSGRTPCQPKADCFQLGQAVSFELFFGADFVVLPRTPLFCRGLRYPFAAV